MADFALSPKSIYKYDHKLWWLQETGALKMISICTTTITLEMSPESICIWNNFLVLDKTF